MGSLASQPVDRRAPADARLSRLPRLTVPAPTTGSTSSLARRSRAASMLDSHRRSPIGRGDTSINRAVADLVDIPSTGKANMPRARGRHHQVSHVVTGDAACGGEEAHGFPSQSQQSSAKATRTLSPLSQPISKPSEHQRRLRSSTAMRPSCRHHRPACDWAALNPRPAPGA